jgi:hypothetical protein
MTTLAGAGGSYVIAKPYLHLRGAISSSAIQETLQVLRNPKVHYRVHNSLPLVPIHNQINPIHLPSPHPHPRSSKSKYFTITYSQTCSTTLKI